MTDIERTSVLHLKSFFPSKEDFTKYQKNVIFTTGIKRLFVFIRSFCCYVDNNQLKTFNLTSLKYDKLIKFNNKNDSFA